MVGQIGEGGGAISLRASSNTYPMTIKRTAFSANVATEGIGGAIHHDGNALLTITDSSFQTNHVGSPGKLGAAHQVVERLGAVARDDHFVGQLAFRQRDQGQFEVVRIVLDQQDGL